MTNPSEDLLVTSEGVDEGSAASTSEGAASPVTSTGHPQSPTQTSGSAPHPAQSEATPAPPLDMESDDARSAREAVSTGQQLEAGEG